MMQVIVTGAAGRLGRFLHTVWANSSDPGFSPLWTSRATTDAANCAWDVMSSKIPNIVPGAVIVHLAGVLTGDKAALAANAAMAVRVLEGAYAACAKHIFFASSSAVYGSGRFLHFEDEYLNPSSDYGRAKLMMERAVLRWKCAGVQPLPGITCLRIGNVLGADALLGRPAVGKIVLDSVVGQPGGPIRSYIGPIAFADMLARLIRLAGAGVVLPRILNIAAPTAVHMADLLKAAEVPFQFGQPRFHATPVVRLSTRQLAHLVPSVPTDARVMVGDWRKLTEMLS